MHFNFCTIITSLRSFLVMSCYHNCIFAIRPFLLVVFQDRPTQLFKFEEKKKIKYCLLCQVNEFIQNITSTRIVQIGMNKMRFEQFFKKEFILDMIAIFFGCCHCLMSVCAGIKCTFTFIKYL